MSQQTKQEEAPNVCHVCGSTGCGLGIGFASARDKDPRWLCVECSLIIEDIRKVKRMDAYEIKALELVDEIAGEYCSSIGLTDMASMDELQRRMLWKTVWKGCASSLRKLVRDGSAPW